MAGKKVAHNIQKGCTLLKDVEKCWKMLFWAVEGWFWRWFVTPL
jgi:hypothetical protein